MKNTTFEEAKKSTLEKINDPTYPEFAKMLEWRNLATAYGKELADSVFVPTEEMALAYEHEYNQNPWDGFEYGNTDPAKGGMYTPSNPTGEKDPGDEFDNTVSENEKLANLNIREGAMTYDEWMKSAGIDTQRDFNAAAKAAAQEYDRSTAGYGANAEAMAQAGLSGAGYSDHITGNAYATRQRSMDSARQTKTLADNASRQGYLNYLENYENTQRGNIAAAIRDLSTMGLTGDRAKQYLSMKGIDEGYADYVVGVVDEMAAEGDPDKQALLAEILNNNLSGDAALSYAKFLGFDDETAKNVIDIADKISTAANERAAAEKAAADAEKLNSTSVDVPSEELLSLRTLLGKIGGDWSNGSPAEAMYMQNLQMFPESQRGDIITKIRTMTDDPGYAEGKDGARSAAEKRADYLLRMISDHYLLEGYSGLEVEKILQLIEGGA